MISQKYSINSVEVKKSIRDSVLIAFAVLLSNILQTSGAIDFGTYQGLADLVISGLVILTNRWMNVLRITDTGKIKTTLND